MAPGGCRRNSTGGRGLGSYHPGCLTPKLTAYLDGLCPGRDRHLRHGPVGGGGNGGAGPGMGGQSQHVLGVGQWWEGPGATQVEVAWSLSLRGVSAFQGSGADVRVGQRGAVGFQK